MGTYILPETTKPEHLFLVQGRISGDDDDTVKLVEAGDLSSAESIFEQSLRHEDRDFESEVFIIESVPFDRLIQWRISESDIPVKEDI